MIEIVMILVFAAAAAILGFGKDGKGVIITDSDDITALTLGGNAVLKQDNPLVFADRFRLIKMELRVMAKGFLADDGPLLFGLASNDLSVTDIAQAISANGPLARADRDLDERATRPVWTLGYFEILSDKQTKLVGCSPQPGYVEKAIRWTFGVDPRGYVFWIQNRSGSTLQTGGKITIESKIFGVWTD